MSGRIREPLRKKPRLEVESSQVEMYITSPSPFESETYDQCDEWDFPDSERNGFCDESDSDFEVEEFFREFSEDAIKRIPDIQQSISGKILPPSASASSVAGVPPSTYSSTRAVASISSKLPNTNPLFHLSKPLPGPVYAQTKNAGAVVPSPTALSQNKNLTSKIPAAPTSSTVVPQKSKPPQTNKLLPAPIPTPVHSSSSHTQNHPLGSYPFTTPLSIPFGSVIVPNPSPMMGLNPSQMILPWNPMLMQIPAGVNPSMITVQSSSTSQPNRGVKRPRSPSSSPISSNPESPQSAASSPGTPPTSLTVKPTARPVVRPGLKKGISRTAEAKKMKAPFLKRRRPVPVHMV